MKMKHDQKSTFILKIYCIIKWKFEHFGKRRKMQIKIVVVICSYLLACYSLWKSLNTIPLFSHMEDINATVLQSTPTESISKNCEKEEKIKKVKVSEWVRNNDYVTQKEHGLLLLLKFNAMEPVFCSYPEISRPIINLISNFENFEKSLMCKTKLLNQELVVGSEEWSYCTSDSGNYLSGHEVKKGLNVIGLYTDPIHNFLNMWVNVCGSSNNTQNTFEDKCYGCFNNLECFIERNYLSLKRVAKSKSKLREFYNQQEFFPISWKCRNSKFNTKFVRLETKKTSSSSSSIKKLIPDQFYASLVKIELQYQEYNKEKMSFVKQEAVDLLKSNPESYTMLLKTYLLDYISVPSKSKLYLDINDWIKCV